MYINKKMYMYGEWWIQVTHHFLEHQDRHGIANLLSATVLARIRQLPMFFSQFLYNCPCISSFIV